MERQNYVKETLTLKTDIESGFMLMGERLHVIFTEKLWEGQYDSWRGFLDEMKLSEPTASKLMKVFRVWVLEHRIEPKRLAAVGYSTLYTATSLLKGSTAEEVLAKASELRRQDVEEEVKKDCLCDDTYELRVCRKCNRKHKI